MQKKAWILLGASLSAVLVAIDFTIVNTSLSEIQRDLKASLNQLQWVIAGFGLMFSTLLVVMGRIGDLTGRRKLLLMGILGFGLSSLGAGLSTKPGFLIAMRIFQGFFGAALFPTGMAVVSNAYSKTEQGRVLSLYGSILGIGLAFGPIIGSIVVDFLSWRWIFFINIPVVILSLIICFLTVEKRPRNLDIKVDWFGAILVTAFLSSLIFVITEGEYYGWTSPTIIILCVVSLLSLIAFIIEETKSKMPLVPTNIFLNRGFIFGLLVYMDAVALAWPILFLAPLYLNNVLKHPTRIVGLALFPMTIMTVIAPIVAGYIYDKKSKMLAIQLTFFFSIVGLLFFTRFGVEGPMGLVIIAFILFGTAWGMGNGIATPLSLDYLPSSENAGLVMGALTTTMNIFAVFILTVATTLFRHTAEKDSTRAFMVGFHHACYLLLFLSIFFWICSIFLLLKRNFLNQIES